MLRYIKENKWLEIEKKYGNVASYVSHILDNESSDEKRNEIRQIVGRFTHESPIDNSMYNAINSLKKYDQRLMASKIMDVIESVNESNMTGGKWIFNSFIKILTALNVFDPQVINKEGYLVIFKSQDFDRERVKNVVARMKSMNWVLNKLTNSVVNTYVAITENTELEYGYFNGEEFIKVGKFKLSNKDIETIANGTSKAILPIGKRIGEFDLKTLRLFKKVIKDLDTYNPSENATEILPATISFEDRILVKKIKGMGEWEGTTLKNKEDIKSDFKKWVNTKSWKNEVLVSVSTDDYYILFKVKGKV